MTRSSSCSFGNSMRPRIASSQAVVPSSGMRKRIAPSSSYALPSATSCAASSRHRSMASSWYVISPSQSMPIQRSDSLIWSTASATSRLVSVFSIRSRHSPPSPRAKSQLKRNVCTPPMCRNPVGLGAMRTLTVIAPVSLDDVLLGAHCSGGVKGALERGLEIGADAVQLFVQSPRTWHFPEHDPQVLAAFRERRREAGLGAVLVHALYLCNLATPDDEMYGKSLETMRSTVRTACAIEADAVVFHVGSHLGSGFEAGLP